MPDDTKTILGRTYKSREKVSYVWFTYLFTVRTGSPFRDVREGMEGYH